MSQAQEALQALLRNVPTEELSSYEHRTVFETIKQRLASAADLRAELQSLYKVEGFSDFALNLMWIAQEAENDPLKIAASPEDVTLVISSFRRAMGESVLSEGATSGASMMPGERTEEISMMEAAGSGDPRQFSAALERLVEAVQSGDEQRIALLAGVVNSCDRAAAENLPDDYKEFCGLLSEFLKYVEQNQLLDDIRVLNILANIPSPVAQWAGAAPEARAGLLAEEISVLRDFKSHFE